MRCPDSPISQNGMRMLYTFGHPDWLYSQHLCLYDIVSVSRGRWTIWRSASKQILPYFPPGGSSAPKYQPILLSLSVWYVLDQPEYQYSCRCLPFWWNQNNNTPTLSIVSCPFRDHIGATCKWLIPPIKRRIRLNLIWSPLRFSSPVYCRAHITWLRGHISLII